MTVFLVTRTVSVGTDQTMSHVQFVHEGYLKTEGPLWKQFGWVYLLEKISAGRVKKTRFVWEWRHF